MAEPTSSAARPPATPDPYQDHDAIRDLVRRKREEWSRGRPLFLRAAHRNILFYRGLQWWRWDQRMNRFRPAVLPKGTPTPVTNKFASTMDAVNAVFARVEPRLNFRPGNPDQPEDRGAADVSARVIEVIESETALRTQRQMLAVTVGLCAQAWLETGYDPSPEHGTRPVDAAQCPQCQAMAPLEATACPAAGCQAPGPLAPATMQAPVGKMYVDVVPPFEMYFDPAVTEWRAQTAYLRVKSVTEDAAKRRWPALAARLVPNVVGTGEDWYGEALPTVGPALDESSTNRLAHTQGLRLANNRVSEEWYHQLPDATYPEGLLAILVGQEGVGYAGPLPYSALQPDGTRRPFLNTVHFPQKMVPGTAWSKSVADDLALLQSKRNRWESIIESCAMRMGSPVWMVPTTANISTFSGEPGAVYRYNPYGPGNTVVKPERVQGQGFPLSFVKFLELTDKDIEEIAATFDVIKGARPEGVSAGIALQILQERGMSRYGPLFILWETAWAEWARQAIEIFREYVTEERLLRIQGPDGAWQVRKFLGADLQGQVDVVPEAGSSMPRSSLVDRAEMEQLAAMGVIDPHDPEIRQKWLETYGRTYLSPTFAADAKNAVMEGEAFQALGQNPVFRQAIPADIEAARVLDYPSLVAFMQQTWQVAIPRVRPAVDDHSIHSREHGRMLKAESSQQLPEIVQVLWEKHKEYHDQLRIQQQQAVMAMMGGGGGGAFTKGYLQPATGAGPRTSPLNIESSPARMEGEYGEMSQDVAAGGGSP